jgi:regulator of sigma E protease
MLVTIISFIVVLSILVFAHELGHFSVARKFGLLPEEFGFGMPPRFWGIYKSNEGKWKIVWGNKKPKDAVDTIYSINWLPLGGFVKLGEDDDPGNNPNHFNNKPVWQRSIILLAGVSMNIVLAAVLISFGYMIGLPQTVSDASPQAKISERKIQIVEVIADSPAAKAELKAGDIIQSINGQIFEKGDDLQNFVDQNKNKELAYKVKRGQELIEKKITPEIREETKKGGIGIAISETGIVRYSFFIAIWEGIKMTIFLTWAIIVAFYDLIKGLIFGKGISIELGGPVRIAEITGDAARMGFSYLINFTALLSINLAIINALPFPALDGGRILFLIIEKMKGKPVRKEIEGAIHYIGFALLMLLVIVVTYRDIARFWK